MIAFPTKGQLKELQAFAEPFCLTMYIPFVDSAAVIPNEIALKNILKQAETALQHAGVKPKGIKKTLRPARKLLENQEFWPIGHESLVLFMHPKMFHYYRLPDHATPRIVVAQKGFYLDPLLKAMHDNRDYYLLVLGHKHVRLFRGDRYRLEAEHLRNFPGDMKGALNIDEYPHCSEAHTIAPVGLGKNTKAYHGQYNVAQTDKQMLVEFFRRINKRLHPILTKNHLPLVIAGVGYLLPLYRQVNTYPGLRADGITGSVEREPIDKLRAKAWSALSQA